MGNDARRMMTTPRSQNKQMFWRIVRRLLGANRGRLFVVLLALGAGAAVTAALLNLEVDAKSRINGEFRAFGPNILITPRGEQGVRDATLDESDFRVVPDFSTGGGKAALLYAVADAGTASVPSTPVVIAGGRAEGNSVRREWFAPQISDSISENEESCSLGTKVAAALHVSKGEKVQLRIQKREQVCRVAAVVSSGSAEDSQIFVSLESAQRLAGLANRISVIELRIPGSPQEIEKSLAAIQSSLSDADVHPIRQFTEGEAKIFGRISGLLTATVAIVLLLTGLCVMAAMTNVAMERKNDVGLMKAIGGATRRVLRLFLAEAALLGLLGGLIGAAAGILLSIWLGRQVFGVAAEPRMIVYPVAVALTILVAILGAFPLRRLASIRPASVFRGEA